LRKLAGIVVNVVTNSIKIMAIGRRVGVLLDNVNQALKILAIALALVPGIG
jgi:hypothetical protein